MNTKQFILTGLLTSLINLLLHALSYVFVLKDVYDAFPAGSKEFTEQLARKPGDLVIWAMVVTTLTMGFLIALIMKWSWARTFATGLKHGAVAGILFWGSVNFGLYASSNHFSLESVLVDFIFSSAVMTLSAGFAAWMLGRLEDGESLPGIVFRQQ